MKTDVQLATGVRLRLEIRNGNAHVRVSSVTGFFIDALYISDVPPALRSDDGSFLRFAEKKAAEQNLVVVEDATQLSFILKLAKKPD